MKRLSKCLNFQVKDASRSMAIFVLIYTAVYIVLLMLTQTEKGTGTNSSINSGFYIGASIYIFIAVIANYKSIFNYFLIFGNTRKNIFLSSAITYVSMSIVMALVSIISLLVDEAAAKIFGFKGDGHLGLLYLIYGNPNKAAAFFWFTGFYILICSFSMLYSSLAYKLGKVFITVFWICFGISFTGFPILLDLSGAVTAEKLLAAFFAVGTPDGMQFAAVNFLITALILYVVTWLISRKQSQVA